MRLFTFFFHTGLWNLVYILHLNYASVCLIATFQVHFGCEPRWTAQVLAWNPIPGSCVILVDNLVLQRTEMQIFILFSGNSRFSILLSMSSVVFMETMLSLFLVVISRTSLFNCICSLTFVHKRQDQVDYKTQATLTCNWHWIWLVFVSKPALKASEGRGLPLALQGLMNNSYAVKFAGC